MQTQKIGKYKIELYDNCSYPKHPYNVKVYNTKCRAYNALQKNYVFRTLDDANTYINTIKQNIKDRQAKKEAKRKARLAFKNPAKVGDILSASWGYDQTNVDYFQVVKVSGKCIWVREIQARSIEGSTYSHGMADTVTPARDSFCERGHWCGEENKPIRKVVRDGGSYSSYYINLSTFASAYKISEDDKSYRSWYA